MKMILLDSAVARFLAASLMLMCPGLAGAQPVGRSAAAAPAAGGVAGVPAALAAMGMGSVPGGGSRASMFLGGALGLRGESIPRLSLPSSPDGLHPAVSPAGFLVDFDSPVQDTPAHGTHRVGIPAAQSRPSAATSMRIVDPAVRHIVDGERPAATDAGGDGTPSVGRRFQTVARSISEAGRRVSEARAPGGAVFDGSRPAADGTAPVEGPSAVTAASEIQGLPYPQRVTRIEDLIRSRPKDGRFIEPFVDAVLRGMPADGFLVVKRALELAQDGSKQNLLVWRKAVADWHARNSLREAPPGAIMLQEIPRGWVNLDIAIRGLVAMGRQTGQPLSADWNHPIIITREDLSSGQPEQRALNRYTGEDLYRAYHGMLAATYAYEGKWRGEMEEARKASDAPARQIGPIVVALKSALPRGYDAHPIFLAEAAFRELRHPQEIESFVMGWRDFADTPSYDDIRHAVHDERRAKATRYFWEMALRKQDRRTLAEADAAADWSKAAQFPHEARSIQELVGSMLAQVARTQLPVIAEFNGHAVRVAPADLSQRYPELLATERWVAQMRAR